MKKRCVVFLLMLLLCLLLGCTALSKSEFAVDYNNTARADEIASYVYDSGLADDLIDSELACKFDTLYELSECFEVECVRAPQEYEQSYLPYAVLLFDNGSRAFVLFDCNSYEILKCLIVDKFMPHDTIGALLDDLSQSSALYTEWQKLDKYNTGCANGSAMNGRCIATSDGVYVAVLGNGYNPEVKYTHFISDDDLFSSSCDEELINCNLYTIWPLLPIDKF